MSSHTNEVASHKGFVHEMHACAAVWGHPQHSVVTFCLLWGKHLSDHVHEMLCLHVGRYIGL